MQSVSALWRDIRADWNKLTRPGRQETVRTSIGVLVVMIVLATLLALCDTVFRNLVLTLLA